MGVIVIAMDGVQFHPVVLMLYTMGISLVVVSTAGYVLSKINKKENEWLD